MARNVLSFRVSELLLAPVLLISPSFGRYAEPYHESYGWVPPVLGSHLLPQWPLSYSLQTSNLAQISSRLAATPCRPLYRLKTALGRCSGSPWPLHPLSHFLSRGPQIGLVRLPITGLSPVCVRECPPYRYTSDCPPAGK